MNSGKVQPTSLPKLQTFVLLLISFAEAMFNSMLYPFIPYMVAEYFDWLERNDKDTDSIVSFYAGLVASLFSLAQFISAPVWGWVSDKVGRRPIILLGLTGNVITAPLFGLAPSYLWALIFRSLSGLMNGNIGVAKAYVTEITDETNSAKLFSLLGFSWGLGIMIGPAIGGWLSRISDKFPDSFGSDSFWGKYPHFLPILVLSLISLIGLIIGYFALLEPTRKIKKYGSSRQLLKNSNFLVITSIYAISGLSFLSFQEVFPLWCRALMKNGGLGWESEGDIGIIQSLGGGFVIIFQLFLVWKIVNKLGILMVLRLFWGICVLDFICIPNTYKLQDEMLWIVLVPLYVIFAIIQTSALTVMTIGINNSVELSVIGIANGIAQSAVSFSRFIGPLLAGCIFGWSLNNELGYPFNSHLIFNLISLLGLLCIFLSIFLDESINKRQKSPEHLLEKAS
ncbi:unnamed protein product [Blepharisma stoltei]|uniref:Major facilitator superfamily (MFS) profile domain-containing protein n=1 Tax=Blepharisma stoltei TaxID=1481888 RepID=A0AAU9INL0_9CILI|nr:unnamed protein product [Blepharisma stoltei]